MPPPRARIGTRLFFAGAVLVLLTGLVVALMGATIARQGVVAEAERRVMALVEQREAHLRDWLDGYFSTARQLVRSVHPSVMAGGNELHYILLSLPGMLDAALLTSTGAPWPGLPGPTWTPDPTAVNAAALSREAAYSSLRLRADGVPVFDVILPLRMDVDGDSALLALHLNSHDVLDPILTDTAGLGQSGELFLLDREMRMLTPSRQHNHPDPLMHTMDIPPARAALDSSHGTLRYTSFLGDPVVAGYRYMARQRWILVGELDVQEALAPVDAIYARTAYVLGIALLILLVITLFLARSWAQPIVRLTRASERVAAGEDDVQVPLPRKQDEVHRLTESFNRMTTALREGREELALTQRRLLQQETMAAVGGLVSSIVHEMRNPLSSIKMNLRLLERRGDPSGAAAEHLDLARQEATRLEVMLGELQVYGKPVQPEPETVDVHALFATLADSQEEEIAQVRIARPDRNHDGPTVHADPELLRRVLENLLHNAAQAIPGDGSITLAAERTGEGTVRLTVQDTGVGMSAAVRERIFDPFFTTRDDGTGLGLANVMKFVDLMDGTLDLESEEGMGTTVTVTLPEGTP